MPAAAELAIAEVCNKVLQTSYLLPFISLCSVAAASIQIVFDFTTEHTQVCFKNYTALEPFGVCSLEPLIIFILEDGFVTAALIATVCFVSCCFHCSAHIPQ